MSEKPMRSTKKERSADHDHMAASRPGDPGHDEWLIDEAIKETFPASDSTLSSSPGSTLAIRYQYSRRK